uniref:TIP41-like protein n=1 Tax=Lygus hesperus TaxID=30085 RepID=A0A0A9XID0_LYGHE
MKVDTVQIRKCVKRAKDGREWCIVSSSGPIASAAERQDLEKRIDIHVPEMCFCNNFLAVLCSDGVNLLWNTSSALQGCFYAQADSADGDLYRAIRTSFNARDLGGVLPLDIQVASAPLWSSSAGGVNPSAKHQQLQCSYDWTYTSFYVGHSTHCAPFDRMVSHIREQDVWNLLTQMRNSWQHQPNYHAVTPAPPQVVERHHQRRELYWETVEGDFDYKLLTQRSTISLFDEIVLFEDELHDNGISSYSLRVRVTDDYFYILSRFFLRVDR